MSVTVPVRGIRLHLTTNVYCDDCGAAVTVPVRGIRLHRTSCGRFWQTTHVTVPVRGIRLHPLNPSIKTTSTPLLSP